jgi:hypothetical protein
MTRVTIIAEPRSMIEVRGAGIDPRYIRQSQPARGRKRIDQALRQEAYYAAEPDAIPLLGRKSFHPIFTGD